VHKIPFAKHCTSKRCAFCEKK